MREQWLFCINCDSAHSARQNSCGVRLSGYTDSPSLRRSINVIPSENAASKPRRCTAGTTRNDAGATEALRAWPDADRTVPKRLQVSAVRHGVLLGRRAKILANGRCLHHRSRLLRRLYREPNLRRSLLWGNLTQKPCSWCTTILP